MAKATPCRLACPGPTLVGFSISRIRGSPLAAARRNCTTSGCEPLSITISSNGSSVCCNKVFRQSRTCSWAFQTFMMMLTELTACMRAVEPSLEDAGTVRSAPVREYYIMKQAQAQQTPMDLSLDFIGR